MGALSRHRYLIKARRFRRNQEEARARDELAAALHSKPVFYDCGICNHWHPVTWNGDCRDDSNRFTSGHLNQKYGFDGWDQAPMPE